LSFRIFFRFLLFVIRSKKKIKRSRCGSEEELCEYKLKIKRSKVNTYDDKGDLLLDDAVDCVHEADGRVHLHGAERDRVEVDKVVDGAVQVVPLGRVGVGHWFRIALRPDQNVLRLRSSQTQDPVTMKYKSWPKKIFGYAKSYN
jgi:hypothetical protein